MPLPVAVVATIAAVPQKGGVEFLDIPKAVDWLEVRGDLTGDLDPMWLRGWTGKNIAYAYHPPTARESHSVDGQEERTERLIWAGRLADLVELDAERDLIPEILDRVPPQKRMISWRGNGCDAGRLHREFKKFNAVPARFYKLVSRGDTLDECVATLGFLRGLGRTDTLVYADGPLGVWTRILAPCFGAPLVYATHRSPVAETGEPDVTRLVEDYGFPSVPQVAQLFGIVGDPVLGSLSPRLHNAAYRALGIGAVFLPFQAPRIDEFWRALASGEIERQLGLDLRGLTVVSPHKESGLRWVAATSATVRRCGSHNIAVRQDGSWTADTTDTAGVLACLRDAITPIAGSRAAVIGCGAAGRASALALTEAGAEVVMFNRGQRRGELARRLLKLRCVPLAEFSPASFDIIVNATPLGQDGVSRPFDPGPMSEDVGVVDFAYGAGPTPLVTQIRDRGGRVHDGRQVLLEQACRQFHAMTGRYMPVDLARRALGLVPCAPARANGQTGANPRRARIEPGEKSNRQQTTGSPPWISCDCRTASRRMG
jgi:3-dehydroquinate dehydratase/shikimate dehydrogenase